MINDAKMQFGEKAAHLIAEDLKLQSWDSRALKGCCPVHGENSASFVYNKKENHFKCFGCGINYGMLDHYQQHYDFSYLEAVKTLFAEVGMDVYDLSFKSSNKENDNFFKNYKYPNEETNRSREVVDEYMNKRAISKLTLDFAGIKQDSNGNIIFEHRDVDGTLLGVKYRAARAVKKGEQQMWWQKDSSNCPVLYGLNRIDITKPLLITEGHIDTLSCMEAGYTNAVSIPHGAADLNWIEFNFSFLENFDEIILWFDNDAAGQKALKDAIIRIGEHKCKVVKPNKDVEAKVEGYYKKYNVDLEIRKTDANNVLLACGKQEVLNLINQAEEIEIPDVIRLMDCEEFDINKADIISTGFKHLDRKMYGYIGGTVNIFTGYSGEGKTTTMMQTCVLPPLEIGETVWIFSGELHKSLVKNWVTFPMAGSKHIIEWDNGADKPKGYSITNEAKVHIEEHYKDRVFFYDNYLNTKPKSIIDKMIYTYKKYGTKVFIIDNLMCLDFGSETEQYSEQKEFLMTLLAVTAKYGFFMHLCAHPRKPGLNKNPDIYSIFGSSSITNLVHRIFWVMRDYDKESPHDGSIWVGKDRMTGISNESIKYYYDRPTRRVYTDQQDLNHDYGWEKDFTFSYPEHIHNKLICNKANENSAIFG